MKCTLLQTPPSPFFKGSIEAPPPPPPDPSSIETLVQLFNRRKSDTEQTNLTTMAQEKSAILEVPSLLCYKLALSNGTVLQGL